MSANTATAPLNIDQVAEVVVYHGLKMLREKSTLAFTFRTQAEGGQTRLLDNGHNNPAQDLVGDISHLANNAATPTAEHTYSEFMDFAFAAFREAALNEGRAVREVRVEGYTFVTIENEQQSRPTSLMVGMARDL
jgi:hypothetical protein